MPREQEGLTAEAQQGVGLRQRGVPADPKLGEPSDPPEAAADAPSLSLVPPLDSKDGGPTVQGLRRAIPPHCFQHSYRKSFTYLAVDLATAAVAGLAVHYVTSLLPTEYAWWPLHAFVWLGYWLHQGTTFTALWVLAHECGHGGFTPSASVNNVVGFVLHSGLCCPYFSWAISHAHHHKRTNHVTDGESWVPYNLPPKDRDSGAFVEQSDGKVRSAQNLGLFGPTWIRLVLVWLVGWYVYLTLNITGANKRLGANHWVPDERLFKPAQYLRVVASTAGVLTTIAIAAGCAWVYGLGSVLALYVAPLWVCNIYLVSITFMQHTHLNVPHFDSDEWTWLRGALSTIDRTMGAYADAKLHHIVDSHIAHHLFSTMPFYGAKEATPYIKTYLGNYYKCIDSAPGSSRGAVKYLAWWRDFYRGLDTAQQVAVSKQDKFFWFTLPATLLED